MVDVDKLKIKIRVVDSIDQTTISNFALMERQKTNYRQKPQHTPVIADPSGKLQPQAVEL